MEFLSDVKIRIMPDVHAGAGCTIGTTMTIEKSVIPNLVGVDIGCGMEVVRLEEKALDLPRLDEVIRANIPAGKEVHEGRLVRFPQLQELCAIIASLRHQENRAFHRYAGRRQSLYRGG